jgi:hypothetical protein
MFISYIRIPVTFRIARRTRRWWRRSWASFAGVAGQTVSRMLGFVYAVGTAIFIAIVSTSLIYTSVAGCISDNFRAGRLLIRTAAFYFTVRTSTFLVIAVAGKCSVT